MVAKLIDALFGCRHSRYSFPVTVRNAARRPKAAVLTGTYVTCLECGREFAAGELLSCHVFAFPGIGAPLQPIGGV